MIAKRKIEGPFKKGLIGKYASIEAQNRTFEGTIILETKNTIKIETKIGVKTIMKKSAEIRIKEEKIQGKKITKRTEDRIKAR